MVFHQAFRAIYIAGDYRIGDGAMLIRADPQTFGKPRLGYSNLAEQRVKNALHNARHLQIAVELAQQSVEIKVCRHDIPR